MLLKQPKKEQTDMGVIIMSDKERLRKGLLEMVQQKKLMLVQAAIQSEMSYRQILRIYQRYEAEGDAGLTHKSRGRQSNKINPHQDAILALYTSKYEGFGPTLASEYLEKDGYEIDHETLRRLLLSRGLWKRQRKRSPYRQRREPKAQFGELVQIDGSIHDWLEIGKHSCLLNMVDDATSKTLAMLDSGETTRIVFLALWRWIKRYGIPLGLYVDLKTVYVSPKNTGLSHLQMACKKLGIRIIKARSPQAKGRVERNHAVYQDRFVKDLRLHNVKTIEGGNLILEGGFIDHLNDKFEKPAKNPVSAHRPLGDIDLNQIFCWEYNRQVQHDWTFSFSGRYFQIEKAYGAMIRPKSNIKVRKHLDGTISVWQKEEKIPFKKISTRFKVIKPREPIQKKQSIAAIKVGNHSNWNVSNSFIFQEDIKTKPTTLRKRTV